MNLIYIVIYLYIMEKYLSKGKLVIPVHITYKKGKKNTSFPLNWTSVNNVDECYELFKKYPTYNSIALLTGKKNNISVLDIDDINEWKNIEHLLGDISKCIITDTNKGFHIYFQYTPELKQTTNLYQGIDVRNDGGCVFCPPSEYMIENDKITYEFNEGNIVENLKKMDNLPIIPDDFLKTIKNKTHIQSINEEPVNEVATNEEPVNEVKNILINLPIEKKIMNVESLLKDIPIECFDDYTIWRNIGFALANYSNKDIQMLEIYDTFSKKSSKYDEMKCKDIWKNTDLNRTDCLTISYIKRLVRENKVKDLKQDYLDKDILYELVKNKSKDICDYINNYFAVITSNDTGKMIYSEKEYKNGKLVNIILIYTDKNLIDKIPGEIKIGNDEKSIHILKFWINSINRKEYRKIIFEPGLKDDINLNLFIGFNFDKIPDYVVNKEKIKYILIHIKEVLCNNDGKSYDYLVKWLAYILQYPNKKMGVAIVCKSQQGAGKNLFFENFFGDMIIGRKHSICVADPSQVVGKFNGSVENKVFTVVNEIKAESDMIKMSNLLKSLITDGTQKIEKKGQDALTVNNYNNYVLLTNNHHVVNVEPDDRRYFCLSASSKFKGNQKYFNNLVENMLTPEFGNEFFQFLMQINLTDWDFRMIPMTKYKSELMKYSINPIIKWFNEWIKMTNEDDISIKKNEMYELYKETSENNTFGKIKFFDYLKNDEKGVSSIVEIKKGRSMYIEFNKTEVIEELMRKSLWVEE